MISSSLLGRVAVKISVELISSRISVLYQSNPCNNLGMTWILECPSWKDPKSGLDADQSDSHSGAISSGTSTAMATTTANVDRLLVALPLFFLYLFGSFAGLRLWIAAQRVPAATKPDVQEENAADKYDTRMRWASSLLISFALSALGYLEFGISFFDWVFHVVATVLLMTMVLMCFLTLTGCEQSSIHRCLDGSLQTMAQARWSRTIFIFSLFFSLAVSITTLWYQNDIGAAISVFSFLYSIQSRDNLGERSMRMTIIGTIIIEVLLLAYITAVFIMAHSTINTDDKERLLELLSAGSEVFSGWISVIFMALPMSLIIPLSLRFDFANHIVSTAPLHIMSLEEMPAAKIKNSSEQLTNGIVIPPSIPFTFKCPYFASALLGWLFANATTTYLLTFGWLPDPGRFTYLFYVLVCGIPAVILSLICVSRIRGEEERMWRYEERWELGTVVEKATGDSEAAI